MVFSSYSSSGVQAIQINGTQSGSWDAVVAACPNLTLWGVRTLRAGLDGYVQSVVVEPRYVCRDYRNLFSNFYSKKFVERTSCCNRLLFFSKPVTIKDVIFDAASLEDAFIGYSVIQPIREHCIGRTVIDPFKVGKPRDSFFCLSARSKIHLNGSTYFANGYPYMAQSGEATVCAHAALWGVCRYLSDRYRIYKEMYPYDQIQLTGVNDGRKVPYRGMTYTDYSSILSAFGCHPVVVLPKGTRQSTWTADASAFHDIYAYLESGFPVLASFKGHVATIVGHTASQSFVGQHDRESGAFYNSYCFLKQYVVVDDNFFPYALLGYASDGDNYGAQFGNVVKPHPSIESIHAAVVPLPEKAFLPPSRARKLAYRFLEHKTTKSLIEIAKNALKPKDDRAIARLFLTSSSGFKDRKRDCYAGARGEGEDPLSGVPVDMNLPHFIWVMEISFISEYLKGYAIGEVVLDASVSAAECQYIYIRIGNTVLSGSGALEDDPIETVESSPMRFVQYTHNLGDRCNAK